MRQIATNYSISGRTITLTGVNVPLAQILQVTDVTTGNILYSVPSESNGISRTSGVTYSQGANSTLTLPSTATIGSTDNLFIAYDDGFPATSTPTFSIPSFTSKTYTTTGGLITKVTYYNGATQVASRNITYSGGVIATDTLSIP